MDKELKIKAIQKHINDLEESIGINLLVLDILDDATWPDKYSKKGKDKDTAIDASQMAIKDSREQILWYQKKLKELSE